jgi:hypothetical protein
VLDVVVGARLDDSSIGLDGHPNVDTGTDALDRYRFRAC